MAIALKTFDRWVVMLCIALTLLFSFASLSNAVDEAQHAPRVSVAHEHVFLSGLSLAQDHEHAHHSPTPADAGQSDHLAGHHHHGDGGSSLILLGSYFASEFAWATTMHRKEPERRAPGQRVPGPERPPKPSSPSS